jgi:hypothetical protein
MLARHYYFVKLPVTGQYTRLSLVMFCSRLLTFTSDGHNAAYHWYLLPVTCMFLPVTNVLEAISYSAVVRSSKPYLSG